jgi:hypothetical protein
MQNYPGAVLVNGGGGGIATAALQCCLQAHLVLSPLGTQPRPRQYGAAARGQHPESRSRRSTAGNPDDGARPFTAMNAGVVNFILKKTETEARIRHRTNPTKKAAAS